MGPSLILDKSAVEAMSRDDVRVQQEYFYTVITPILVSEICADIQKLRDGKCDESKVRSLAKKANPLDSVVTGDWRILCKAELLGRGRVEIGRQHSRRAVVLGGHFVPIGDGKKASWLEPQPEAMALLRWSGGTCTSNDETYATRWRETTKKIDLISLRRRFGIGQHRVETTEALTSRVAQYLRDPSLQTFLLALLLEETGADWGESMLIKQRWGGKAALEWQNRCPYARLCLRTLITFYWALGSNIVGTKATNRLDIEYLLYLPFCSVFVSGDEGTHGRLAPLLLESDQRFVRVADFRAGLSSQAEFRASAGLAHGEPQAMEFPDGSLILDLWRSTWNCEPRSRAKDRKASMPDQEDPKLREVIEKMRNVQRTVEENRDRYPQRPPWPQL
jgi:hypothetical protein